MWIIKNYLTFKIITCMATHEITCRCQMLPIHYTTYNSKPLGVDDTKGRYADVTLNTCVHCGTVWVKYHAEFESYGRSGRWYLGVVTEEALKTLTPENTVAYLESLPGYFYGGSYFNSPGKHGHGTCYVDM